MLQVVNYIVLGRYTEFNLLGTIFRLHLGGDNGRAAPKSRRRLTAPFVLGEALAGLHTRLWAPRAVKELLKVLAGVQPLGPYPLR